MLQCLYLEKIPFLSNRMQRNCKNNRKQRNSVRVSLVTQMVNNLPAMQETWIRSLGWEDPLEKGMATHSSYLKNPTDRGAWRATVKGSQRVGHD